jgi:vitamin B12 transporter
MTLAGMDWMSYEFDQRQDGDAAGLSTRNTAQSDFDNISGFLMGDVHALYREPGSGTGKK